ncbi:accessory factor associated with RNA polymerase II [Agyrium rufum]|nr:accessory factor associated with RNA polymerase II [Agyrium rufum]
MSDSPYSLPRDSPSSDGDQHYFKISAIPNSTTSSSHSVSPRTVLPPKSRYGRRLRPQLNRNSTTYHSLPPSSPLYRPILPQRASFTSRAAPPSSRGQQISIFGSPDASTLRLSEASDGLLGYIDESEIPQSAVVVNEPNAPKYQPKQSPPLGHVSRQSNIREAERWLQIKNPWFDIDIRRKQSNRKRQSLVSKALAPEHTTILQSPSESFPSHVDSREERVNNVEVQPQKHREHPFGKLVRLLRSSRYDRGSPSTTRSRTRCGRSFFGLTKHHFALSGVFTNRTLLEQARQDSATWNVLSQASHILHDHPAAKRAQDGRRAMNSELDIMAHHLTHRGSNASRFTDSSSIRNIRIGRVPVGTPDPEAYYLASDGQRYLKVELGTRSGPAYLPSEARRVGTPPLPTRDPASLRGFFFDYRTPFTTRGEDPYTPNPKLPGSQHPDVIQSYFPPMPPNNVVEDGIWSRLWVSDSEESNALWEIDLDVPEHLPNSPLCAKSPKHLSRGRGTCIYHGKHSVMLAKE